MAFSIEDIIVYVLDCKSVKDFSSEEQRSLQKEAKNKNCEIKDGFVNH